VIRTGIEVAGHTSFDHWSASGVPSTRGDAAFGWQLTEPVAPSLMSFRPGNDERWTIRRDRTGGLFAANKPDGDARAPRAVATSP
jgi:hypothetical protein